MKLKNIKRPIKLAVGWLFFLFGLITAPFPIPLGQIIALIGLGLLISESRMMRKYAQKIRRNYPSVNNMLEKIRPYLPGFIKNTLDETHPRHLCAIRLHSDY